MTDRSAVRPIPEDYHTASPYLIVSNAAEAIEFYKRGFDAAERRRLTTVDGKVMHAESTIGNSVVMLSDEFSSHNPVSSQSLGGCAMFVVLYVENVDAVVAQAAAAGATVLRPVADEFFGDRSGTLLDRFGYHWTITTHIEAVSDAEINRRFAQLLSRTDTSTRKAAWILAAIALIECGWVVLNLRLSGARFIAYLGFASGRLGNAIGWVAACFTTVLFIASAARLASVREHLLRPSFLKLLALLLAIGSGILEEVMFRRWTMNWVQSHGFGAVIQVLVSGIVFGLLHAIWGLPGKSVTAALGATLATGLLGMMLGIVFLLAGRSLAPCITAHFLINVFAEPGLVLAAVRGEMHRADRPEA